MDLIPTSVIGAFAENNIGRALTNLIGNCVATAAIARWEKDIDILRANKVLSGQVGYTFQLRTVHADLEPNFPECGATDQQRPQAKRRRAAQLPGAFGRALEENEAVVRAIRSKNSARTSAEMRRHIIREGQRMGIELNIPDDNHAS